MKTWLNNSTVIYPELSYSIVGAAMVVHNSLKPGWDERDYHRAMVAVLESRGHVVKSHDRKDLVYRGGVVDGFELDLLVDGLVILELKHLKEGFHPSHYTQIINYLKRWDKRLGLLINYGQEKLRYQRIPFSCSEATVDYVGEWVKLPVEVRDLIRGAVNTINSLVGCGYGAGIYKKLLMAEPGFLGVKAINTCLAPTFSEQCFEEREVDAISVGEDLIVRVSASSSATDLSYLKTYMKHAGAKNGMLVNLNHHEMQLRGVR
ncbi:hypothetical protein PDESU_04767 [Pontiella desulfatans]|uniref:GxxExxY protein n=1 Tax=Pontiella desulfatans TaxID=2750659 RepID=A0A6C2U8Y0_PONDE|nr:GxxExxY protein [Pontiella desulfatans]VGO16177.1 hypothetical protein PDESU_04767 [Pontiella desulfatans]